MIGITAALVMIAGGIAWLNRGQYQQADRLDKTWKVIIDPAVRVAMFRKEIIDSAERRIKAIPDGEGRYQKEDEIRRERDLQLLQIGKLELLIQGISAGDGSEVAERAIEILDGKDPDRTQKAIDYLDRHTESTLEALRRNKNQFEDSQSDAKELHAIQQRKLLHELNLKAGLLETKLEWESALKLRNCTLGEL